MMNGLMNVKSPNNISKWQMGFNSAFKGLNSYMARFYPAPNTDNNRSVLDQGPMRAFPISFNYEITAYIVKYCEILRPQ
jgi:hypothetical protein